jgi:hypothetical protein
MNKSLLLGLWRILLRIPRPIWQQEVAHSARAAEKSLAFMTADHHKIRDFVVRELPGFAKPISPETIAQNLNIELNYVITILMSWKRTLPFFSGMGTAMWNGLIR